MAQPIIIDLPHKLGAQEAKRRMQGGIGKLEDHLPGAAEVESHWTGDRMHLRVRAIGQEVSGHIDVGENIVRLELMLPPVLAMLGGKISGLLRRGGTELLEDKSKR